MMAEQIALNWTDLNSVRKAIVVQASREIAWKVFTEQLDTWWPLAVYKIGKAPAVDVIIEPRVAGRWYERGDDGSTCDWGRVLLWEPPSRLILSWDINADFQYVPNLGTEIEVRFLSETEHSTRVELEHRRLDRFGDRRDQMRTIFDQTGDWGKLLESFAGVAERSAASDGE